MAWEDGLLDHTFTVSGNGLSADADQFIFVKLGLADNDIVACAVNDSAIGISQDTNTNNTGLSVRLVGVSKLRLAGTVNAMNKLRPDANGEGVVHLGDNNPWSAIALTDGVDNDVIPVLIERGNGAT